MAELNLTDALSDRRSAGRGRVPPAPPVHISQDTQAGHNADIGGFVVLVADDTCFSTLSLWVVRRQGCGDGRALTERRRQHRTYSSAAEGCLS